MKNGVNQLWKNLFIFMKHENNELKIEIHSILLCRTEVSNSMIRIKFVNEPKVSEENFTSNVILPVLALKIMLNPTRKKT